MQTNLISTFYSELHSPLRFAHSKLHFTHQFPFLMLQTPLIFFLSFFEYFPHIWTIMNGVDFLITRKYLRFQAGFRYYSNSCLHIVLYQLKGNRKLIGINVLCVQHKHTFVVILTLVTYEAFINAKEFILLILDRS